MTLPVVEAAMEDLRLAHGGLLRVVDSLADDDWSRCVPYGGWTVKELVARCIGDMSPSGIGLILAGILTPEFIAETAKTLDVRARDAAMVAERRDFSREDLRQMLFACHDAMYNAARKLSEDHLPVLGYAVPMGPDYELQVQDWLWHGYYDRQHADDIRRALEMDWRPEKLTFLPQIEEKFRLMHRYRQGFLRAVYSVDDEAWPEESPCPGWSYRDLLAHVVSNELRVHARFRSVLGEADEAELSAINDVDGWNQRQVEARRGRSVRQLVDELAANHHQTMRLLSALRPQHLSAAVTLADGSATPLLDYIAMSPGHQSMHAGQLVPASRARRWQA